MENQISKLYDEFKELIKVQGEIRSEVSEIRAGIQELKNTQKLYQEINERDHKSMITMIKEYKEEGEKETQTIWGEIAMLKDRYEKHEADWNQIKAFKKLMWFIMPVLIPGTIIVLGKFVITNFSKIFGIFID